MLCQHRCRLFLPQQRLCAQALNRTGTPVYLSGSSALCDWEDNVYPPEFHACEWAPKALNAWRIGGDHHGGLLVLPDANPSSGL